MISKRERNGIVRVIVDRWTEDEEKYKRLEKLVADFFENQISSTELLPTVTHRVKPLISMVKTAIKKGKNYDDIGDKLGFRIICHFKSELPVIKKFLVSSFDVRRYECKADGLKFDALGYVSDHYDVSIKSEIPWFADAEDLKSFIFEIQVRTICQHAWADVAHSLSYKQDIDLDQDTKRRIFRLTSLLEICDDEFDDVNDFLLGLPESWAFTILRCVEGKFYKYAKMDYDKDLSVSTIGGLLSGLNLSSDFESLYHGLHNFLEENDTRIRQIFSERRSQIGKDFFLSQPEILFVWFLIERYQHSLIPAWRTQFDVEDLKDISITWGVPITLPE